jgi:uncharacterized GH25 family protein
MKKLFIIAALILTTLTTAHAHAHAHAHAQKLEAYGDDQCQARLLVCYY